MLSVVVRASVTLNRMRLSGARRTIPQEAQRKSGGPTTMAADFDATWPMIESDFRGFGLVEARLSLPTNNSRQPTTDSRQPTTNNQQQTADDA